MPLREVRLDRADTWCTVLAQRSQQRNARLVKALLAQLSYLGRYHLEIPPDHEFCCVLTVFAEGTSGCFPVPDRLVAGDLCMSLDRRAPSTHIPVSTTQRLRVRMTFPTASHTIGPVPIDHVKLPVTDLDKYRGVEPGRATPPTHA